MLARLKGAGLSLSIATNKRIHPTRLILEHLGWSGFFDHVYALDLFAPRLPHKAAMIERLIADRHVLVPRQAVHALREQLQPHLAADTVGSGDGGEDDGRGQGLVGALFGAVRGRGSGRSDR